MHCFPEGDVVTAICYSVITSLPPGEGTSSAVVVLLHKNMLSSAVTLARERLWVTLAATMSSAYFFLTIGSEEAFMVGPCC